jgi:hypothetical protein
LSWKFALMSATQLPLIVAIAEIGTRTGHLQPETAASLVGAGLASVLLFPIAALAVRRLYMSQPVASVGEKVPLGARHLL